MIKIIFAALLYPYADLNRGYSYEYYQFLDTLKNMSGVNVKVFDWVKENKLYGKEKMNANLLAKVKNEKPDLVFFSLFRDEFNKNIIKEISNYSRTINWFSDDLWRFKFVLEWARWFTNIISVNKKLKLKFKENNINNAIFSQFACNPRVYKKLNKTKKWDVTFVGQTHSNRKRLIKELIKNNFNVEVWGKGWENGPVAQKELINIFNQSKINLNFTTTSFAYPFGRFIPGFLQPKKIDIQDAQIINGRLFEVTACSGFLLTSNSPDLDSYFKLNKEIAIYDSISDLVDKIDFYSKHDVIREKIADAGYKRLLKEHTYEMRFKKIFEEIGFT